jgi:hypothetical protein
MLYTTFNNAQKEDWQKIDGNGNLACNEIFHYHSNLPKFTRKIKYGKHTRNERIHKTQIGPNAVLVLHTKDVSYTSFVLDHILLVLVHMKKKHLKINFNPILFSYQFKLLQLFCKLKFWTLNLTTTIIVVETC